MVLFSGSGAGVPVASRPRGRGVRSEPGVTVGARGPQRWRGTGSGARGPQARNQSVPTHKLLCRKVTFRTEVRGIYRAVYDVLNVV